MTYISSSLTKDKKYVKVWTRESNGERTQKLFKAPYYFYAADDDSGDHEDLYGFKLSKMDYVSSYDYYTARKTFKEEDIPLYESDIRPEYKTLSEHFYGQEIGPLNITFLDIEVDYDPDIGFSSPENPYAPINSVAIYHEYSDRTVVLAVPPKTRPGFVYADLPNDIKADAEVVICDNEADLIERFLVEIENSDILSGWHSDPFDMPYIYERAKKAIGKSAGARLSFPEAGEPYYTTKLSKFGDEYKVLNLKGRVALDYLEVYKKFEPDEKSSYKLEHVSEEELPGVEKISYEGSLHKLYNNDFEEFIRYNIRDTIILKELEKLKKYIKLIIQMSHMGTSELKDVLGTIKLAETTITNFCHYDLKKRVPDKPESIKVKGKYDGATVILPKVGMHEQVGSTDLKSLYPSVMIALNISPETIMGEFVDGPEAFRLLNMDSDDPITFVNESNGKRITSPASNWKSALLTKNWAVSGGGTVYTQEFTGVIPMILSTWFAEREDYKKKKFEAEQARDTANVEYYDRMQYIKKIQLNSLYGACGNPHFKFYDVRMAESTTLSGREVLYHMARKIAEVQDGVYDMTAQSIIYGDTDSVYFKTYKDTAEDSLVRANEICDIVNESYPEFMAETFLCDNAHRTNMKAEQEIISDRGIFIAKKYYMLHVNYDDGKQTDKMKFMGVPIKKTTLPKAIKLRLSSFIGRLLNGEDWDIIGPDVVKLKDELKEIEDVSILGKPTGVNKVEQYTAQFNAGEPDLRLPGHVAASILWNKCLSTYGDKESPRIRSGNKIAVYYLTKKIDNFKSIAVPKDLDTLPDWFMEHFMDIIDRDLQIEKLVDVPMKIMISAAGIKVPTKKKLVFEEGLFE